jgi:hypothetical protein
MGDILKTNKSSSNPNNEYYIMRGGDGAIYCTCPGWRNTKNCRHLKEWHAASGTQPIVTPAMMGVSVKKGKTVPTAGPSFSATGPMLGKDKVDSKIFNSDEFQAQSWYQGCGAEIETDKPDDMLAKLDEYEAIGKWVAESKSDGINISVFSDGKRNRFWSRNSLEKEYGLANMPLPPGTLIAGELGAGSEHALERRAKLGDYVDAHSILVVNYKPLLHLSETERREALEDFHSKLDKELQKHFLIMPRWTNGFRAQYEAEHEGLVLKSIDGGPYIGRKTKPSHWVKAKKWFEADMVIMDIRISDAETKKAEPMTKDLLMGQYVDGKLKGLSWVGSMTDTWSKEFASNFGKYKGTVAKIAHNCQFKSGALRHASFMGLRDDKDAIECVFDPSKNEQPES